MTEDLLHIPAFLDRNKTGPGKADHAVLSPSSAHRWIRCPGSIRLAAQCENVDSEYAQEGTDAHTLAASCLLDGSEAWEHIGTEFARGKGSADNKFTVSKDMADAVQIYLDYCRANILVLGDNNFLVETRFDLSEVVPHNWGTSDLAGYDPKNMILHVVDYKHGIGVAVDAEENEQEMNYAAGVIHELSSKWPDIREVWLHIVQPRSFHEKGPIRVWKTTVDALGEWVSSVLKPAAEKAMLPDAPVGPIGDHCQFCPAQLICPAQGGNFKMATQAAASPTVEADVVALESFELADWRSRIPALKKFIAAIEDEAFRRLQKGEAVPGAKLVAKKSDRVWKPEAEALAKEKWGDDAYAPAKLLSPAAIEKLRDGKAFCAEHAFKPDTGLTIADDDDKRPAVKVRTAAEVFANVGKS